jgi:hypothetical protein
VSIRPGFHSLSVHLAPAYVCATGDRHRTAGEKRTTVGYDHAHAIVDDLPDRHTSSFTTTRKEATVTAFVERALGFFAKQGIVGNRLMADG